jgi:hypothetical protein
VAGRSKEAELAENVGMAALCAQVLVRCGPERRLEAVATLEAGRDLVAVETLVKHGSAGRGAAHMRISGDLSAGFLAITNAGFRTIRSSFSGRRWARSERRTLQVACGQARG